MRVSGVNMSLLCRPANSNQAFIELSFICRMDYVLLSNIGWQKLCKPYNRKEQSNCYPPHCLQINSGVNGICQNRLLEIKFY